MTQTQSDDLVTRLLGTVDTGDMMFSRMTPVNPDGPEAAAEIQRLQAQVAVAEVENGEPDEAWRAIPRAIDQFVGRVPRVGKHRALNNVHLRETVERLDAAGDHEAADTIVWLCWWRAIDRERERFLLADAEERIAALASIEGAAG